MPEHAHDHADPADDHVEVYTDKAGEKRWRYKASNGRVLADSAEGYQNLSDLYRSLKAVTGRHPTIVETKGAPLPGPASIRVLMIADTKDRRPHSRACGIAQHDHGQACSENCPTCGGRADRA